MWKRVGEIAGFALAIIAGIVLVVLPLAGLAVGVIVGFFNGAIPLAIVSLTLISAAVVALYLVMGRK